MFDLSWLKLQSSGTKHEINVMQQIRPQRRITLGRGRNLSYVEVRAEAIATKVKAAAEATY